MTKIVPINSVVFTTPILDARGKQRTREVKGLRGLTETIPAVKHVHAVAGIAVDAPDDVAAELVKLGLARAVDLVIDEVEDTTTTDQTSPAGEETTGNSNSDDALT